LSQVLGFQSIETETGDVQTNAPLH
jgi:hypothetical protein